MDISTGSRGRRTTIALLAAAAAALAAVSITVIALGLGSDPEENKVPPSDALSPSAVAEQPPVEGTVVGAITEPLEWGRFRILPTGGVPAVPDLTAYNPGHKQKDVTSADSATPDDCASFTLYVAPDPLPEGYALVGCREETIVWDDGTKLTFDYKASYAKQGQFPISLFRGLVHAGQQFELVAEERPFATTLLTLAGSKGVLDGPEHGAAIQGPFQVSVSSQDTFTQLETTGAPLDELLRMAESVVNEKP